MSIFDLGAASPAGTLYLLAGPNRRRGVFSLLAIAALILMEILALTMRFDGATLERGPTSPEAVGRVTPGLMAVDLLAMGRHWMLWTLGQAGVALKLGGAAAAAVLLFSGRRLSDELSQVAGPSPWRWSWSSLLSHLAALTVFAWLTGQIFEGAALESAAYPAWLIAWLGAGAAVLASLVAIVLPPDLWRPLARRAVKAVAVGVAVGIAAIGGGWLTSLLWRPMGRCTMDAVHSLLGLAGTDLVYEPAKFVVGTSQFSVNIAPQCSGYEGIGLIWAFLGAYLWIYRRRLRFPRAWLLLPIGAAAMWLVNVVRIAALVAVGTWVSADIACGGFHSQAGWLGFIAVSLGLMFFIQSAEFFRRPDSIRSEPTPTAGPIPETVYLAPLLAIVAAGMITAAFSCGGFDSLYPARLAAVAIPLWLYRRQYAAMRWACSWQSFAIGAMVFALWNVPQASGVRGAADSSTTIYLGAGWAFAWLLARTLGSAITVPIAEELAFRGFLSRWLITTEFESVSPGRFTWTSFIVSSLAFGLLHGDRWLEGTLAGMLYALAYYRRGSLGDAVAAHATTNALLSAEALITGNWSLWS